jgi:hypothetical protein
MRRSIIAVAAIATILSGCKAKEAIDNAAISADLDKRGTVDLMEEAAKDEYQPPADGKLTDAQIKMYLKVREHEKKIVEVAKAEAKQHADKAKEKGEKSLAGMMEGLKTIGSVADMATADIRAAKDLGLNSREYTWVKEQILAASGAALTEKFTQSMTKNFDDAYAQAKKGYDEAKDETTKKMYGEMLAGYDKTRQEMASQQTPADPAVAHNRQLLAKYDQELNAFAHEFEKWEDKPGEVQKAVDQLQKKQ